MGRGRSKARQTKVARDLKYATHEMDLEQLAEELHGALETSNEKKDIDPYGDENFIKRV